MAARKKNMINTINKSVKMNTKTNQTQETPEVMSSSDSPSSYDIMAQNYDDWQEPFSSSYPPLIKLTWNHPPEITDSGSGASNAVPIAPKPQYSAYHEKATKTWHMRLTSLTCGIQITIYTGGFQDADVYPPITEPDAIDAINEMNGYQARGTKGENWHTVAASKAHENHHKREWVDTCEYYFAKNRTQRFVESLYVADETYGTAADAVAAMKSGADAFIDQFNKAALAYWRKLPDNAGSRPYCAGQKELKGTIENVISISRSHSWAIPTNVTTPGTIEPPCFLPPVNGGSPAPRSMATPVPMPAELLLRDTQDLRNQPVSLVFRNMGETPMRILDVLDVSMLPAFLDMALTDSSGRKTMLCARCMKVDFSTEVPYRSLAAGEEYQISVPFGKMVQAETWDKLSSGVYTLEAIYHNQYGDDCLKGSLTASCEVVIS